MASRKEEEICLLAEKIQTGKIKGAELYAHLEALWKTAQYEEMTYEEKEESFYPYGAVYSLKDRTWSTPV